MLHRSLFFVGYRRRQCGPGIAISTTIYGGLIRYGRGVHIPRYRVPLAFYTGTWVG